MATPPTDLRRARRINMLVLLSTTAAIVTSRFLWWRVLPIYFRDLGATDQQVAIIYSVTLVLLLFQIVGGLISDRWGRRYSIGIPTLLVGPALVLAVISTDWRLVAISVWSVGVIQGLQGPGFQALLAESATDEDRGRLFGLFFMIQASSQMIGPALGAAFLAGSGFLPVLNVQQLIWTTIVIATLAGVVRLLFLREGQFNDAAQAAATRTSIGEILSRPAIRWLIGIHAMYMVLMGITFEGPFIALHLADTVMLPEIQIEETINLLFAVGGVGGIVAALIGGALTDRLTGQRTSVIFLITHVVGLIVWSWFGLNSTLGYILFALSWMALWMGQVAHSSWTSAYAPTAIRGRVLGLMGAIGAILSAFGPTVGNLMRTAASNFVMAQFGESVLGERVASGMPFVLALAIVFLLAYGISQIPAREVQQGVSGRLAAADPIAPQR
ncbi:MAG: MFS transporter [Chloroflexi bacterium]|nr:MFS transporter [Chloroflexota bacterium]